MPTAKRFPDWKIISIAAVLLLFAMCLFVVRKAFRLDIELGMDRAAVMEIMGAPCHVFERRSTNKAFASLWIKEIVNQEVFQQQKVIWYDNNDKVKLVRTWLIVFGRGIGASDDQCVVNIVEAVKGIKEMPPP